MVELVFKNDKIRLFDLVEKKEIYHNANNKKIEIIGRICRNELNCKGFISYGDAVAFSFDDDPAIYFASEYDTIMIIQ